MDQKKAWRQRFTATFIIIIIAAELVKHNSKGVNT